MENMLQFITAIAAVFMGSASPHIIRQCPCSTASLEFGVVWSSKCWSSKPPPKPDDSNTCEPTPPSCTGQWCTSCDEVGCIDIDGPGITASLCDGEFSWCTDDGECGEYDGRLPAEFGYPGGTEFPGCTILHKDLGGGEGLCDISCDNGFAAKCGYNSQEWGCFLGANPEARPLAEWVGGANGVAGNPCGW